jgi:glycosidase
MLGELRTIGQHCDGVRCDMAMLILNDVFGKTWGDLLGGTNRPASEFWTEAIMALPELVWIAEVYWDLEWSLQQLGFQFTYDRRLYDRLRKLLPGEIVLHLKADFSYQSRLVRFLENHDEPRSATVFGKACLPAISTLMATLPGMRLYHQGQLEGRTIRHPVQLCMATEEPLDQEAGVFYKRLLRITNEEVFHNGQWKLVTMHSTGDSTFENLVAYQWKGDSVWKIVVVNLSPLTSQGRLYLWNILKTNCQSSHSYVFHDQLNDQVYERHQEDLVQDGLYVSLNPFGAHVFAVSS